MRFSHLVAAVLLGASALALACDRAPTSSPELEVLLAAEGPPRGITKDTWATTQQFYNARRHTLAWSTNKHPTSRALRALETLRAAEAHGLDRARYFEPELTQTQATLAAAEGDRPERARQLADFDVRLTAALLQLGRHVATGHMNPATMDPRWNARREMPDVAATLQRAWEAGVTGFLDAVRPVHLEYRALQKALVSLRGQASRGWPTITRSSLKAGQCRLRVLSPVGLAAIVGVPQRLRRLAVGITRITQICSADSQT